MTSRRKLTSSRLRQRLTLQQEVMSSDNAGGYVRTWTDVANLWAEITPISGRERLFAVQVQAEVTHRILLRYRSEIIAGNRLLFESRAFNIRSVVNVAEKNELLEILAEEGVAS